MKRRSLAALAVSLLAMSSAFSATFKLPTSTPAATITIPDAWKPEAIDKGVQAQTDDNDVYLSIEATRTEKDMNAIIDGTYAMLKDHKVILDMAHKKEDKFQINGLPADELVMQGQDETGPTMVSITFVTTKDATLVFTYWASPEGDKKHSKELAAIVQSIKAIK